MKLDVCISEANAPRGNVLIVKPEKRPVTKDIAICVDSFEKIIRGSLEALICKERGVAFLYDTNWNELYLPVNRALLDRNNQENPIVLHGTFIVMGFVVDDGNTITFTGLSKEQLHFYKTYFAPTVRVEMVDGKPELMFNLMAR